MSWVLIGGERVLKVKKPIRYPFPDFTDVRSRERNAREEVRLNRRLAPHVYLGILALRWHDGRFSITPDETAPRDGDIVDWVVSMRRLPAERMLDRVIAGGDLKTADVEALQDLLAFFFRRAVCANLDETAYLGRLRQNVRQGRRVLTLPRFALSQAQGLIQGLEQAIARHEQLLRRRVRERRIIDGHGDLRPEHVCLIEPPVIIDALEFDRRLRQVDPFAELCFLGLECAMAGDSNIGPHLIAHCADKLNDHPPDELLQIYTAHHALLRARLGVSHLLEAEVRTPEKWLPQARYYLERAGAALNAVSNPG